MSYKTPELQKTSDCPTCGQPLCGLTKLIVDTNANVVIYKGTAFRMPRGEITILNLLNQAYPKHVSLTKLVEWLWDYGERDEPDFPQQAIQSRVSHMRRRLAPMGIRIEAIRHIGYRMYYAHEKEKVL